MDNKKKNYYYKNNKNYYYKKKTKKENKPKNTYDKLVNVRNDVDEIESSNIVNIDNNYSVMKLVAISIVVMAIVFGSLLLFHLF